MAHLGQYSDILVQENFAKAKDHAEVVKYLEKVVKKRWKSYHVIANKAATAQNAFQRIVDAHLHGKATGQGEAGTFKTVSTTDKKKGGESSTKHLGSGCSIKRDHVCNRCKGRDNRLSSANNSSFSWSTSQTNLGSRQRYAC